MRASLLMVCLLRACGRCCMAVKRGDSLVRDIASAAGEDGVSMASTSQSVSAGFCARDAGGSQTCSAAWTSALSTVPLNDGVSMPVFGLGLYQTARGEEAESATYTALKLGYRMLDTAMIYRNEEDVGKGVKRFLQDTGTSRGELFVVTKLWNDDHGYEKCKHGLQESLKKLQLDYVDLYLMHSPRGGKVLETYQCMLDMQKQGLIRSVGVSNFGVHHLEALAAAGKPLPSVNQIELHPWQRKSDIVDYCREKGITLMAYSSLAKADPTALQNPDVLRMAKEHGKSAAQVLLRYGVQMGFIVIPKSRSESRLLENMQIFDFELSAEDVALLNTFPQFVTGWDPTIDAWQG